MTGIYAMRNKISNKYYVGQARNISRRVNAHFLPSNLKDNSKIARAINKYEKEDWEFEVLEECSVEDLNEKEIFWIGQKDSFRNGYNSTEGGLNGSFKYQSILSEPEIISIRTAYNSRESFRNVYSRYAHKMSESGFSKVWYGESWGHVMPEVFTNENKRFHHFNGARTRDESLRKEKWQATNLERHGVVTPMSNPTIHMKQMISRYRSTGQSGALVNNETGEFFFTPKEAAVWSGLSPKSRNFLTNKTAGRVPGTSQRATWRAATPEEINNYIKEWENANC